MRKVMLAMLMLGFSTLAIGSNGAETMVDESETLACEHAQETAQQTAELMLIQTFETLKEDAPDPMMEVYPCECLPLESGEWECTSAWSVM